MKIWQLNQELKEANHRDQAWHMAIREGSNSRAVWKMCSSSYDKCSVVAHATTSTDIEVGEEFEESSNSDPNDVYVAPDDDPMCSSGDEFDQ